jgi:hypothetical protein
MDGHFGDSKALGKVIEIDCMIFNQQIDDRLSSFVAFHGISDLRACLFITQT